MTSHSSTPWQACIGALDLALAAGCSPSPQSEADKFLATYEQILGGMYPIVAESFWKSSTDVTDIHVGERIGAEQVWRPSLAILG